MTPGAEAAAVVRQADVVERHGRRARRPRSTRRGSRRRGPRAAARRVAGCREHRAERRAARDLLDAGQADRTGHGDQRRARMVPCPDLRGTTRDRAGRSARCAPASRGSAPAWGAAAGRVRTAAAERWWAAGDDRRGTRSAPSPRRRDTRPGTSATLTARSPPRSRNAVSSALRAAAASSGTATTTGPAPIAAAAASAPSRTRCGTDSSSTRSLALIGSPSAALTRSARGPRRFATLRSFTAAGKEAPPRPRSPACSTRSISCEPPRGLWPCSARCSASDSGRSACAPARSRGRLTRPPAFRAPGRRSCRPGA